MCQRFLCNFFICLVMLGNAYPKSAKDENWIEVSNPRFVVVSDGSERQARQIIEQFEQFRIVCKPLLPQMQQDPASPLFIFAVKNEAGLKVLMPELNEEKGRTTKAILYPYPLRIEIVLARVPGFSNHS